MFATIGPRGEWRARGRWRRGLLLLGMLASMVGQTLALTLTDVTTVNVTPEGFSVVFHGSEPVASGLSVYADAGGLTNLAGQVGIELLPLHTGNPALTEPYPRRQNNAVIRQKSMSSGLGHVRVTGCRPNATYYYRVRATGTNGQETVWPPNGPLPAVTTATETAFVKSSKQLVVELSGDAEGRIVTLSHASAAYALAAVGGDGVGTNQFYFALSDLIASIGNTNFIPVGDQQFDVQLLGAGGGANRYTLNFAPAFAVADISSVTYGSNQATGVLMVGVGSTVLRAGDSGSVPVSLSASGTLGIVNFTFDVPPGRLTNLTIQSLSPAIQTTIQPASATQWQVTLAFQAGKTLTGTQKVAQINFTAVASQSSAFVPLQLVAIDGRHGDSSSFATQFGQSGRITVVAGQPLLEAQFVAGGRQLILYGVPGATYQIQIATSLGDRDWSDWTSVSLTNLSQVISGVSSPPVSFFRALQVQRSRLEIQFVPGGTPILLLHGTPGSSYQVEIASSLAGGGNWTTWARVPLVGASQIIPGAIPPGGAFFRAYEFS
ncbi:MAG TPA: hypothetical protein VJW76_14650, partial [Verrucomicrobiae bacterium]|nr:hypothetical protein [Verrucomicrobiae bacterium]